MIDFKKTLPILLLSICFAVSLSAQDTTQVAPESVTPPVQEKPKTSKKDKIYYGGNIGLSFGSYTMIAIRPLIGYKITPKLSAGVKLSYEYIKDNRYNTEYNTSNYGGSLFARYRVLQPLYVHAEYAAMNYELYNALGESQREWVPFFLVGAGYSQKIGGSAWLNVEILFDVLQSNKSPYNDWEPFYSVGVGVGF